MIIELGNHSTLPNAIDDRPKITTLHIPEADADGLGGYSHEVGTLSVSDFKDHLMESVLERQGITRLPDHEALVSILHPNGLWSSSSPNKPEWVSVSAHELTPKGRADDIEQFLSDYWQAPKATEFFGTTDPEELEVKKQLQYWTKTEPGVLPSGLVLPDAKALYTNVGRVISNVNDGGGTVGAIGVGSAATSTSFTVSGTPGWASNLYAGYRIVVYSTTSNNMVWGNITANGTGANPSITVDQWYVAATPGGSAATTPSTPWAFMILDGGFVSTWFVGLATGVNAPVATDTTLSTNGNVEQTTNGLQRKIAPYAQTSGVASRAFTLTPVYTYSSTGAVTLTTIGVFASMVVGTAGTMKFETALNASATVTASGDQLTVTETVTGS